MLPKYSRYITLIGLIFCNSFIRGIESPDNRYWRKNGVHGSQKAALQNPPGTNKTISLIIPCYHKHARQLYSLLHMYENQTRLPDEVVISLSDADLVNTTIIQQLEAELWAFPVTLLISNQKQYAGENRNIACSHAIGDVFLCQDADDIPHPQRVELIHYFFSTYTIDHLMHRHRMIQFAETEIPFEQIADIEKVQFAKFTNYEAAKKTRRLIDGTIAIARHVFDEIKWNAQPRAEDVPFNRAVYKKFKNCIVIRAILYGYRQYLSSTKKDIPEKELSFPGMQTISRKKQYKIKIVNATTA